MERRPRQPRLEISRYLDGRRTRCETCGSDVSLWNRCLACHRRETFERIRDDLIAERREEELPVALLAAATEWEVASTETLHPEEAAAYRELASFLRDRAVDRKPPGGMEKTTGE